MLKTPFEDEHVIALRNGLFDVVWPQVERMPHLRFLKTNFLPPWSVMRMTSLKTLHLNLWYAEMYESAHEMNVFEAMVYHEVPEPASTAYNIILDVDFHDLNRGDPTRSYDTIRRIVPRFMTHLVKMGMLQLRIRSRSDPDYLEDLANSVRFPMGNPVSLAYNGIMQFLDFDIEMEALVIDACDVDWVEFKTGRDPDDSFDDFSNRQRAFDVGHYHNKIQYIRGLHRIVVPQSALFECRNPRWIPGTGWYTGLPRRTEFQLISLPPTVERIEIIDPTRALNRWAQYVLENPAEYPCLKTIVLWCDKLAEPLGDDARIRSPRNLCEDCKRDERWMYKLEVDMSDKVWDDIKKAVITLECNTERKQGWREIS